MSDTSKRHKSSKIPKLDDYKPIIDAAKNGKLVLFVGNGVSRLLGYPSWDEMAERAMLNLFDDKKGINHIDFLEKELLSKLPPKKRLSIIHDICKFKDVNLDYRQIIIPDERKSKKIYEMLYSMKTPLVTTNYDECLGRLANVATSDIAYSNEPTVETSAKTISLKKAFYEASDLTDAKLDPGVVIHIHGSLKSQENMVVSTRQYIENYKRDGFVDKFLEGLFSDRVILFIGYGIEEEEIFEYIVGRGQKGKDSQSSKEAKHYCLYPTLSSHSAIFQHLKNYYNNHCNITLISYEVDVKGYDVLEEIIHEWAKEIGAVARRKNYIDEQGDIKDLLS